MRSFLRPHNPEGPSSVTHAAQRLAGACAALAGCLIAYMGGLALLAMAVLAVVHGLALAPLAPEIRAIAEVAVPAEVPTGPQATPLRGSL